MNVMADASCSPISLEQLLIAREARSYQQQLWLNRWGHTLISTTLVWPGEVKDTPESRAVMAAANDALTALITANGWEIIRHNARQFVTGPESFWSVNAPASQVKKATIRLEESHPLGRLWDIDVFCPDSGLLSRKSVGEDKRRCFLCDEPAHVCSRMRRHPLHTLHAVMEDMIDDYFCHQK
ncbi:holo-ACP synthase [Kosakonia arachidis]|uniref:Apo-citrate lyase phosphoribosyl-dephospho-CoA transferase n=1 Tax=Kosakonia arachidis TaxID=551989 RepID=A0A1I6ZXK5_9ENTR|nr:citrate lyase holo-[acyl-carrier protein] synthase [Kosakonia arachidis]SFT67404.1 holo-ACP synthase [Kosakonia arachidis]